MAIAKLSIDIEARLANLQAGLDKAGLLAQQSADRMNGAFKGLQSTLKGVFAVLGARELIQFFNATVDGVDKLNDLADATGASVENLSALEDIAVRTGTSVDTMADAIIKMNKSLADAKPGSDQAAAFDALGLSIKELKALDPVEAFQKVAIALQGFANDGNKARLVQELFGKSLRDVAPLLKDAAEAGKLVATVTKEQVAEAEKFNKELFAMQKNVVDVSRWMAGPLVNAVNEVAAVFREGQKQGKGFFETLWLGTRLLDGQDGGGATGSWEDATPKPSLPEIKPPKKSGGGSSKARSAAKDELLNGPILDPEIAFRVSEASARASVDEALRIDRLNDMMRERAGAIELVSAEQKKLNDLLAATPTAQLEETRKDMIRLAEAFEQGKISAEQFSEAASTRLGNVAASAKEAADEWSVFADEAARNIQDALGDTLQATMEGNWRAIGDAWKRTLDRMVAEALAAKLGQALLGDFGKTGNVGGLAGSAVEFFSTLFASAKGNAFAPGGVLAFASGGVVNGATPFTFGGGRLGVMGEAGPEAIVPLKRGRDGTLGVGGGIVVNQTINLSTSGPTDRRSIAQLQTAIGLATQRAIARNT